MKKLLIILILIFASCSTAPKSTGDIFFLRAQAEEGMETANREAAKGNFELALSLLTSFKRNAILADDPSLIIRVSLSRGNVLFLLNRLDEAFAEWDYAIAEAQRLGNAELLSVSRVYRARGNLVSGRAQAQSVLDDVNRESANIRANRIYIAFSWQVRGLALRSLALYREAEHAMLQSLAIHERDMHLENASYDWYTIASIRSLAGDLQGSLRALEQSIAIDRRIENSWGLAANYRAMGDVYRKTGQNPEALFAYERARSIYIALGNDHEISEINRRILNQ
ncbi:MAG: tetratricopeptide repeat protein [Treponema sp.]|nr:tetratricopeptide repeat protein [Treponema sp.]